MEIDLRVGDSLQVLKELEDNSIDSVVTDPPYGLSFMGKKWDYDVPTTELWKEVIRVLKPGGHLLSFSSSRTYHRMAVAVEDAGFEIRDQIMWVYGSGFPKSHNIGKAYEAKLKTGKSSPKAMREARMGKDYKEVGYNGEQGGKHFSSGLYEDDGDKDWNPENQYKGWGTALKPAHEPIVLARKPFKGTVVDNVIKHGTGGINIDKSRVEYDGEKPPVYGSDTASPNGIYSFDTNLRTKEQLTGNTEGRFPANFIHDGSDEVVEHFPQTAANLAAGQRSIHKYLGEDNTNDRDKGHYKDKQDQFYNDAGSASRYFKKVNTTPKEESYFIPWDSGLGCDWYDANVLPMSDSKAAMFFYCAKVSKKERNAGLNTKIPDVPKLTKEEQIERYGLKTDNYVQLINLEQQIEAGVKKEDLNVFAEYGSWFEEKIPEGRDAGQDKLNGPHKQRPIAQANTHPTVKPIKLMSYLVNLITPEGGIVLDPFMGSGSTGMAAKQEGFDFIGIELDESYVNIAKARIDGWE